MLNKGLLYNFIVIALYTLNFCSCSSKKRIPEIKFPAPKDSLTAKIYSIKFYYTPDYSSFFTTTYKRYEDHHQFDSMVHSLIYLGALLDKAYTSDTLFSNRAFKLVNKDSNSISALHDLPKLYLYIGSQYSIIGKNDSALYWYNRTKNHPEAEPWTRIFCNSRIGEIYSDMDDYEKSILYYLQSLKYYEVIDDTINIAISSYNIASQYQMLRSYTLAKKYLNLCEAKIRLMDKKSLTINMLSIRMFMLPNTKEDSIQYLKTAAFLKTTFETTKDLNPDVRYGYYRGLYEKYECYKEFDSLPGLIAKMEICNKEMNNKEVHSYVNYLKEYDYYRRFHRLKDPVTLLSYAKEREEENDYSFLKSIYDLLFRNALATGKYSMAEAMHNEFIKYSEKKTQQNERGKIIEYETQYQTEKKNQQLKFQSNEVIKLRYKLTAASVLIITLLLSGYIFYLIRKRNEVVKSKRNLEQYTDALFRNTEEERHRISKDLHDGISNELLLLKNKTTTGQHIQPTEIDKVIQDLRTITHDLYPMMFESVGLKLSIEVLCERLTDSGWFTYCEIEYNKELSSKAELQLFRIIQEFLNNTVKYAKAVSTKVTIRSSKEEIAVELQDGGKGFNLEDKEIQQNSFGIQSMFQRARSLGAKCNLSSNEKGTNLKLIIPI